jgi:hypothetical protein
MKLKTLSKTRFKLALECPSKVSYSLDGRYANQKRDDEFLEGLAQSGDQVGALAKLMFQAQDPDAVEITASDQDGQFRETAALLKRINVTIFEATILHDNLLVRVDVLAKRGRQVDLIEVKAKSWDPNVNSLIGVTARENPITPDWEQYVYDVAFQERVLALAYPEFEIRPWLMLVDKSRTNSVDGLPLKFPITGEGRKKVVTVARDFAISQLKEPLLIQVDAREAVRRAQTTIRAKKNRLGIEFDSLIQAVANAIRRGERLGPFVGQPCKSCEFYCPPAEQSSNVRSGWAECMETHFHMTVKNSRDESIFGFHGRADTARFIEARRLWMRDVEETELNVTPASDKISPTMRQELQWREIKHGDTEPFLRAAALKKVMDAWRFPLHFIDFETAQPALPFHVGHRPYQQILFQFSHHVVSPNGTVCHATECLLTDGNSAPSIDVVRRLRDALGDDTSTILHWYPHEKTVLRKIHEEIEQKAPVDKTALLAFLDSLGLETDSHLRLFDLGRLVANQVFLAGTGGSSSMKKFLPAVLRNSTAISKRYARPIYGTATMPSHNFCEQVWVVEHDGAALDPYQLLSPLFGEHELDEALTRLEEYEGEVVANGAAAMIAYARLQDPQLPAVKRKDLRQQLLRYCELDTLAMVMVYEALKDWVDAPDYG